MAKIKLQVLQNCCMQYSKWLCYTALATCKKTNCIKVAMDY